MSAARVSVLLAVAELVVLTLTGLLTVPKVRDLSAVPKEYRIVPVPAIVPRFEYDPEQSKSTVLPELIVKVFPLSTTKLCVTLMLELVVMVPLTWRLYGLPLELAVLTVLLVPDMTSALVPGVNVPTLESQLPEHVIVDPLPLMMPRVPIVMSVAERA